MAKLEQYNDPKQPSTQFIIEPREEVFVIKNVKSGKYVNVEGGSKGNGAKIQQWDNPECDHSQFWISSMDDNQFEIRNKNSNKVLSVEGGSQKACAAVVQLHYESNCTSSMFRIIPYSLLQTTEQTL